MVNYEKIVKRLLKQHLNQTIELYGREEDVRDLEPVLIEMGISSNVLEPYMVH